MALLAWAISAASEGRGLVPAVALTLLIAASGMHTLTHAFPEDLGNVRGQTVAVEDYRAVGAAIGPTLRADDVMAVRTVGVLPFAARAPIVIDTLALNNPELAHHNEAVNAIPGHQKEATFEQLLRWRPSLVVAHPVIESTDQTDRPPARDGMWAPHGYRYVCLPMAGARFTCFFRLPEPPRGSSTRPGMQL
jgi:hypothetical protein